jgi:3-dehydroquinate dehydratase II
MILLVNGPNLNLLGEREPEIYGSTTLADVERMVSEACAAYGHEVRSFQSNHEGALIDFIQQHRKEARGLILNPGAFTHTSYALYDCLKSVAFPVIEVHVTNVHAREEWRRKDLVAPATKGQIIGLGPAGYYYAAVWLCSQVTDPATADYDADAEPAEVDPDDVKPEEGPLLIGGDYEG